MALVEVQPKAEVIGLTALVVSALWWRTRWVPLLVLLAGMGWALAYQGWLDWQQQCDRHWLQRKVVVDATVRAVQQHAHYQRLTLHGATRSDGARLRGDIWCYLYGDRRLRGVMAGDHLHGALRLHPPHRRHNPGGFDFAAYCRAHHVVLLGAPVGALQSRADPTLLATLRQRVRDALRAIDPAPAAVLSALLLADRSRLDDAQWQRFSASGTAHLLAISGLHIGMVAGWGVLLAWWLLTRREAWIVALPVRRCALLAGVVLALGYATLAGWSLPTQRAVLMLAAAAAAWWLRSRSHPLNTMLAALMVVVTLDPLAVGTISLWLSFVAVTALIVWGMRQESVPRKGWRGAARGLLWVSVVATLATLPLIAGAFGRFPLYALPANLLLVPLYGVWILPSSLSAAVLAMAGWSDGAHGLLLLASAGVKLGGWLLACFHQLPGGSWWLPRLPWWWLALSGLLLVTAGVGWGRRHRFRAVVAVGCAVAMLLLWPERDVTQTAWTVWDVGQGAAATLRFPGGAVMALDAPGSRGSRFNGGTTVAEGLRAQGVTHLDVVAVSHLQADHAGGIASLLRRVNRVGELWLADVPENRAAKVVRGWRRMAGRVRWLARGDVALVGGHRVRVLWPPRGATSSNANNLSLVLSLDLGHGKRLLAMGDSEAPVERRLVRASIGRHDLLLVPHHGSATSSTWPLLRRVRPRLAILQTGWHNRFHFPAARVVARYRRIGAAIVNTAYGAVTGRVGARLQWRQMGGN